MIEYNKMRQIVKKGLEAYLGCPVVRTNQNDPQPDYDFVSYTITVPMSENKGTYSEYEDGTARKSFTQTWSISALSDDNARSVELAVKAREWFDFAGAVYLSDNDIIVQSVGVVTNRDNILTVEYEYKNGFDVVFSLDDVIGIDFDDIGWIEDVTINESNIHIQTLEERIAELEAQLESTEAQLNEANEIIDIQTNALRRLKERLEGGGSNE